MALPETMDYMVDTIDLIPDNLKNIEHIREKLMMKNSFKAANSETVFPSTSAFTSKLEKFSKNFKYTSVDCETAIALSLKIQHFQPKLQYLTNGYIEVVLPSKTQF